MTPTLGTSLAEADTVCLIQAMIMKQPRHLLTCSHCLVQAMGLKQGLTAEKAQHAVAQVSLEASARRAADLADDARILRRQVRALNKAKAAVVEERCACASEPLIQEPPCSCEAACSVLDGLQRARWDGCPGVSSL